MVYKNIVKGIFEERPNRFIAKVLVDDELCTVHVKNTGRCRELLIKGAAVYLAVSDNPNRKTKYDLVAVLKERKGKTPLLINMDSQIPNDVVGEWLPLSGIFSQNAVIRREVTHKSSRFDFYVEDGNRKAFIEVKGVTLENGGIAAFPDAPTERGVKHINELVSCLDEGFEAYIVFVIQMKEINFFTTNDLTHKEFGIALRKAQSSGVKILAYDCRVTENSIEINKEIPCVLE